MTAKWHWASKCRHQEANAVGDAIYPMEPRHYRARRFAFAPGPFYSDRPLTSFRTVSLGVSMQNFSPPGTDAAHAPKPASVGSKSESVLFAAVNTLFHATHIRLVLQFHKRHGCLPNIADPRRYSERMLWRKIVDHNPLFVLFSDKLATKDYMRQRCPDLPVPRTLWIGRDADAIPESLLRGDVLVKANHGCNFNLRLRSGTCDRKALRRQTRRWLRSTFGRMDGQWAYSKVAPRLFVEEAVGDAEAGLLEFNIRASHGKALLGSVLGRCKTPDQWSIYLDPEGTPTHGVKDPEGAPITPLPQGVTITEPYRRAVEFTRKLSVGVDYARFDFLWNGKELFGGEITVYPAAGKTDIANATANRVILSGWDMRQAYFLQAPHTGWKRLYAEALNRRWRERVC